MYLFPSLVTDSSICPKSLWNIVTQKGLFCFMFRAMAGCLYFKYVLSQRGLSDTSTQKPPSARPTSRFVHSVILLGMTAKLAARVILASTPRKSKWMPHTPHSALKQDTEILRKERKV